MARALITGGAGFIGSHLSEALLQHVVGYEPTIHLRRTLERMVASLRPLRLNRREVELNP